MNKALLVGRLTKDPELRTTPGGVAVTRFTIAISEPYTNKNGERETNFINCVAWGRQADNVSKYCKKGALVSAEGRIQTRNYENNEGRKVYVTEVIASNVQFLESKNATNNSEVNDMPEPPMEKTPYDFSDNSENSTSNAETMNTEKDPFESFGEQIEISDNDLPF